MATKDPVEMDLEFGFMAKSIKEQLSKKGYLISDTDSEFYDVVAGKIFYLHLHEYIPDSVRDKAMNKLARNIGRSAVKRTF